MAVDLYDHQKKAVEKLRSGSVLCGGVGTGKSRTALAYFYTKVCKGKLPRRNSSTFVEPQKEISLYIITTAKKRDTKEWDSELSHFLMSVGDSGIPVTVDSWNNIKKYVDVANAFFIFDEQRVVGTGTWVKSFLKIAEKNEWVLLTATPGDRWIDYAPIFIANGYYKNITEFRKKHVIYNSFVDFPKIDKYVNTKKLEYLRDKTVVYMTYHKDATPHHSWVKVGYDEDLYTKTLDNRWDFRIGEPIENPSQLCYALRRIVNEDMRRLTALCHIFEKHPKIIVFYNFDYELERLRYFAGTIGTEFAEWNGHRHEPIPNSDRWLYLVQYTAGAEGWNCIETDTMVFYSQNYSYKTVVQSAGRINRLNTEFADLFYYHLVSDAPIDNAIRSTLKKKRTFNESAYAKTQFQSFRE